MRPCERQGSQLGRVSWVTPLRAPSLRFLATSAKPGVRFGKKDKVLPGGGPSGR